MTTKPIIVQHCFGVLGLGGPMSGVRRLLESELAEKYQFETCFQTRPAGGINIRLMREMAARIRSLRPDLLHVRGLGNEGFHGLMAGRMAGCRRILVSVHGLVRDQAMWRGFSRYWREWVIGHILEPYTLRHADGVYCVCAYDANRDIIRKHSRHLLGHVHNGVDLPPLTPPDPELRASFGFSATDTVAVYVGRLAIEQKGLLYLCEAARLMAARGEKRLKILLVGDGPDRPQIETAAAGLPQGQLVFAGQRNDVFAILRACDFLVLPSLRENLPNVLIEAMACQRAIVVTDVCGNREVVVSGETGILVPSRDPNALADAMQSLAHNPEQCRAYGVAGRRRAEACFSMNHLAAKLDEVYQEMLHS
jgi:glycosyltransferase involved in cell wall biosynthesis